MRPLKLLLLLVCLAPAILSAQTTLTWDPNGDDPGTGTGGGDWDTSTPNWGTVPGGVITGSGYPAVTWLNDGTAAASFPLPTDGPGTYTINVNSAVQVRGIGTGSVAWGSAQGVTFTGTGSIALTDPLITVESVTTTFDVPLLSTVGLNLNVSFAFAGTLQLNTANPDLLGVTTISKGTLVYNQDGALGPGTVGNGIVIGDGTLHFNNVIGGSFAYVLADPISITAQDDFNPHISIAFETYASRSVTLSGPIALTADAWFAGGPFSDMGTAQIISSGVISDTGNPGRDVKIEGDVFLSGTNTFTGKVIVAMVNNYSGDSRVTVPEFNDEGEPGPLGAGSGLELGRNAGEGGPDGEVIYTGGNATSNRTIQIEGDTGVIGITNSATTLTLTGVISGSDSGSAHQFEKTGPGTLVLRGDNTFSGETQLTNGTLVVGHNDALGTGSSVDVGTDNSSPSDNISLLLENGISLGKNIEVYNNNSSGSSTLGLAGTGTATFGGDVYLQRNIDVKVGTNGSLLFTGHLSDGSSGGTVNKTGVGLAVFSGGVDISGSFDVSQGELRLNGAVNVSQTIDVYSGGTLSGNATINQGLFVAGGGTLSPGDGVGTLTVDLAYLSNSGAGVAIKWQLGALTTSDTAQFDRIVFTGAGTNSEIYETTHLDLDLSLLGISQPTNANLLLNDLFWQSVQTWAVIDFTNGSGTDNLADGFLHPLLVSNATWAGGTFDTFVGGGAGEFAAFAAGDVYLRFTPTAVPEPATSALLLGLGSVLMLLRRRHAPSGARR